MFKYVFAGILVLSVLAGLAYFQMYQHADRIRDRIEREALDLFDRRDGISSIEDAVKKIAQEEKITILPNGLDMEIVESSRAKTANMVGIAAPNSGTEAVIITITFKDRRFFFSHTTTRKAKKTLYGKNDPPSANRSSGGFTGGVNMSRPGRDVGSHRNSINRAVSGRNP